MLHQGNKCPRCGKDQMPNWEKLATARSCQACGHVEERKIEKENK
jgi:Zn ribbon nucleic-acid-binding protein